VSKCSHYVLWTLANAHAVLRTFFIGEGTLGLSCEGAGTFAKLATLEGGRRFHFAQIRLCMLAAVGPSPVPPAAGRPSVLLSVWTPVLQNGAVRPKRTANPRT
jgi:hypothetical protein